MQPVGVCTLPVCHSALFGAAFHVSDARKLSLHVSRNCGICAAFHLWPPVMKPSVESSIISKSNSSRIRRLVDERILEVEVWEEGLLV